MKKKYSYKSAMSLGLCSLLFLNEDIVYANDIGDEAQVLISDIDISEGSKENEELLNTYDYIRLASTLEEAWININNNPYIVLENENIEILNLLFESLITKSSILHTSEEYNQAINLYEVMGNSKHISDERMILVDSLIEDAQTENVINVKSAEIISSFSDFDINDLKEMIANQEDAKENRIENSETTDTAFLDNIEEYEVADDEIIQNQTDTEDILKDETPIVEASTDKEILAEEDFMTEFDNEQVDSEVSTTLEVTEENGTNNEEVVLEEIPEDSLIIKNEDNIDQTELYSVDSKDTNKESSDSLNASNLVSVSTSSQLVESEAILTAEELYQKASTDLQTSRRWHASKDGYELYPQDKRFGELININAKSMIAVARRAHREGRYSAALVYYNEVNRHAGVDTLLINDIQSNIRQAENNQTLVTAEEELYKKASTDPQTSRRWHASKDGYELYPQDKRFGELININAKSMIAVARRAHREGRYSAALVYYNEVNRQAGVDSALITEIQANISQAENNQSLVTADDLYKKASTDPQTSRRWHASKDGYNLYPEDTRFKSLIEKNSADMLAVGKNFHMNKKFDEAKVYYRELMSTQYVPSGIYSNASTYKNLADNRMFIIDPTYQNTFYNYSLQEMLSSQLNKAPTTDMYGGGFKAAKSVDVERYLNANNFHELPINTEYKSVQIRTSNLNVRSGPDVSYNKIGVVKLDQVFDVSEEKNNWYKINYNNTTGWISGDFVNKINSPKTIDSLRLNATVTADVLNVRGGPSTDYSIKSQVTSGSKFVILKQENGWVNIEMNNGTGWVSGDYVTINRSIEKGLLQFLKLSGSSGISVSDLNKELGDSGVMSGLGHVFTEASKQYNINEIYLLGHSKLETGSGYSELATGILVDQVDGKAVQPKVVYNMFGIGAFDSAPKKAGSEYAYKMGWDTVEKSILGGAKWISERYVNHPTHQQDTLYKMRWNPLNPGSHQYATDIGWAYKQTHTLNRLVELSQKYNLHLRFDIPIYQ